MKLKDRVAVVTGSSQGIGQAIASYLAAEGARVVVTSRRTEALQKVAREIIGEGGRAVAIAADVTDGRQVEDMVGKVIDTFGRIDILVNCAGGALGPATERYVDVDEETWDAVLALNLKSQYLCCKAVVKHMTEQRSGKIVNIASEAARRIHRGPTSQLAYTSSKAGVLGLTRALALDLGPYGINVNAVLPGVTNSSRMAERWASLSEGEKQATLSDIPLRRIAEPREIASVVAFLASDEASYITGASIDVNGGRITS